MKNYEDSFFDFLNGKMNPIEQKAFEEELQNSESLQTSLNEYKKLLDIVTISKNLKLNPDYSQSIITNFRKRLSEKESHRVNKNYRYVFASIIMVIIGYFLVSQMATEKTGDIQKTLMQLSSEELNSLAYSLEVSKDFENNFDDNFLNKIDSMYSQKLVESVQESIEDKSNEIIVSAYSFNDVEGYLTDNDIELIYSQLIDKEIL